MYCFRGYNELKIGKNIECEIFQVILEEAMESYDPVIVQELHNNGTSDIERNTNIVVKWINQWMTNAEKRKNKVFDITGVNES
jgi:adenylate kinase